MIRLDTNLTWYSPVPEVTSCFQQTTLVWLPALFLWVVLPVYGAYLHRQTAPPTPRCSVNITKMVVVSMLAFIAFLDIIIAFIRRKEGYTLPDVYFVSPAIAAVTFTLSAVLAQVERWKGFITSGVLFLFWTLHLLVGCISFYSHTTQLVNRIGETPHPPGVITFYIQFLLVLVQLVLSCFSEAPLDPQQKKVYPEYRQSFLCRITYHWLTGLVKTGHRKPLEETDVWSLDPRDQTGTAGPELAAAWNHQLQTSNWFNKEEKTTRLKRQLCRHHSVTGTVISENGGTPASGSPDHEAGGEVGVKVSRVRKSPSFLRALVSVYGYTLLQSHLCKLVCDILVFVGPLLQRKLIQFTTDKSELAWKGYLYAGLFFIGAVVNSFFFQQLYHTGFKLGTRIRCAIITEIYKKLALKKILGVNVQLQKVCFVSKSLTLSHEARQETPVGEIVTLMSVDAQKLQELTAYLWMIWSSPLQIIIAMFFLWKLLGASVLVGVFLMFVLLPANVLLGRAQRKLQVRQMRHKDERTNLMHDILNGIKVLKLYAWELSFKQKVEALRHLELTALKHYSYLDAGQTFTFTLAPFGVMLATITTYVLSGHTLDAQTAFVALSLFNVLHFPINKLPQLITNINTAKVSIKRIEKFLKQPDVDTTHVTHNDLPDPITFTDATLSWGSSDDHLPILNNVRMTIQEGQFVAVVGEVGSGKSSLIAAILGDLLKVSGSVNVKGQIAYTAQEPWIQNATVRDNITFGKEFVDRKYKKILEACALKTDMDMLPAGDLTEIGEKGVNLSGGQRQRVSLARAAYSTTEVEVYLLDDPLSAVDSHVGKHIFDKLLGKKGLLRNKTRVMVTNGLHWLPSVDHVIVLENGEIAEQGSYEHLLSHDGPLAQLVKNYLIGEDTDGPDEDLHTEIVEVRRNMLEYVESLPTSGAVSRNSAETTVSMKHLSANKLGFSRQSSRCSSRLSTRTSGRRDTFGEMERFRKSVRESKKIQQAGRGRLIGAERREVGSVKLSVFLTYGQAMGMVNMAVLLTAYFFYAIISVLSDMWVSKWTSANNSHLLPNSSQYIEDRNFYLGVYGGLGLFQGLFVLIYAVVCSISMVRASRLLHEKMLTNVLRSPMAFFDTTPIGRVLSRFSGDVDTVDMGVPAAIKMWLPTFFKVLSGLFIITYSTPWFLLPMLFLAPVYFFILRFYIPTSRQLQRLEATARSPIFAHFGETVTGASTIRAFGQTERFMDVSNDLVDHNQVYYLANMAANRWLGFRLDMLSACVVLVAALFAVLGRDTLTGGAVGLSISYALQATGNLNWMVRTSCDLEAKVVSVERVKEYSELKEEAPWYKKDPSLEDTWPQAGHIKFYDYEVRYRPNLDLVLKGIKADIPGGQKVGIVGRTGAGKSSLTLALFRIIEGAQGSIKIDGISIADLGLHQLRSKIAILPQESMMFSGTLRDNLDPLGQHKDDILYQAIEKAHLLDFVHDQPEELNYECGEGGQNLSVGQRQMVGLARAMLHKSRLLILDEATAAVDMHTDDLIQQTIRSEFSDSTILTIAHRLNTIMDYDRIMVLDQGKVAEFASPAELLANRQSIFYSMAKDAGIAMAQNTKL